MATSVSLCSCRRVHLQLPWCGIQEARGAYAYRLADRDLAMRQHARGFLRQRSHAFPSAESVIHQDALEFRYRYKMDDRLDPDGRAHGPGAGRRPWWHHKPGHAHNRQIGRRPEFPGVFA